MWRIIRALSTLLWSVQDRSRSLTHRVPLAFFIDHLRITGCTVDAIGGTVLDRLTAARTVHNPSFPLPMGRLSTFSTLNLTDRPCTPR